MCTAVDCQCLVYQRTHFPINSTLQQSEVHRAPRRTAVSADVGPGTSTVCAGDYVVQSHIRVLERSHLVTAAEKSAAS